jgi:hypothetical protein
VVRVCDPQRSARTLHIPGFHLHPESLEQPPRTAWTKPWCADARVKVSGEHGHCCHLDMTDSDSGVSQCETARGVSQRDRALCSSVTIVIWLQAGSVGESGCDCQCKLLFLSSMCLHWLWGVYVYLCVLQTVGTVAAVMWLCVTLNCATDSGYCSCSNVAMCDTKLCYRQWVLLLQ